jgi:hypothetical protein
MALYIMFTSDPKASSNRATLRIQHSMSRALALLYTHLVFVLHYWPRCLLVHQRVTRMDMASCADGEIPFVEDFQYMNRLSLLSSG